ncbi:hypothetical protein QTP88_020233 [Uroleucon formosanum]
MFEKNQQINFSLLNNLIRVLDFRYEKRFKKCQESKDICLFCVRQKLFANNIVDVIINQHIKINNKEEKCITFGNAKNRVSHSSDFRRSLKVEVTRLIISVVHKRYSLSKKLKVLKKYPVKIIIQRVQIIQIINCQLLNKSENDIMLS